MENNRKLWFKARNFGWGWEPITWQGWIVVFLFVVALVSSAFFILPHEKGTPIESMQIYKLLGTDIIAFIILMLICTKKGERPTWRWGNKK